MDNRFYKIVIGLALQSEIYNRKLNRALLEIYSNINLNKIKALHDKLIISEDHSDREAAFWLELALQQAPIKANLRDLIDELKEMEALLFDLLWRVRPDSQRSINDWLNYIANAAQSLQDGYGIDAKILMSQALQSSKDRSIEELKLDPNLTYMIETLKKETLRIFEEIKNFPLSLRIAEEWLGAIVELQEILIDLLQRYYLEDSEKEFKNLIYYPIQKLEAAQRYLIYSEVEKSKVKQEIEVASTYLEPQTNSIKNKKNLELMKKTHEKLKALIKKLQ